MGIMRVLAQFLAVSAVSQKSARFSSVARRLDAGTAEMVRRAELGLKNKPSGVLRGRRAPKHDFVLGKFYVCIVGKPNVGKSTVYNRLVRRRDAIVTAIPGTTRDRKEGKAQLGELEFTLCDTGGYEDVKTSTKNSPTELLSPRHGTELVDAMQLQMMSAIRASDVLMMVVDGKEGITSVDLDLAKWVQHHCLRKDHGLYDEQGNVLNKGIFLVANKCEGMGEIFEWGSTNLHWANFLTDCYKFGFGEPIPISAEHGQGFGDIHNALLPFAIAAGARETTQATSSHVPPENKDLVSLPLQSSIENSKSVINLAIVGRPNVGKSTLVNSILGQQRCIAGPVPGLTRDSIAIDWEYEGRQLRLLDTAGIRRRTRLFSDGSASAIFDATQRQISRLERSQLQHKTDTQLEDLSIQNSLRALKRSQVVVVVLDIDTQLGDWDAGGPLTKQDLKILEKVADEGRAMVIVANKCDLAEAKFHLSHENELVGFVQEQIDAAMTTSLKGVPVIPISAATGKNVGKILPTVINTYDRWRSRIPTAKLNQWLEKAQIRQPPPAKAGAVYRNGRLMSGPLKIKYMTQASTRPPTFVGFVNRTKVTSGMIPETYHRYLLNSLRTEFGLQGIPARIFFRGSDNDAKRVIQFKNKKER